MPVLSFVPFVAVAAVIVIQIRHARSFSSRSADMQRGATEVGMRFDDHTSVSPDDLRFQFFTDHGGSRWFGNAIQGTWDGVEVFAGDYTYGSGKEETVVSLAIAQPPAPLRFVSIRRHAAALDAIERVAGTTIDFEMEAFNRAFQVVADDRAYAISVIDQSMMDWLLTTPDDLLFEIGPGGILVVAEALPAARFRDLLDAATGFAKHVPATAGEGVQDGPGVMPPRPDEGVRLSPMDRAVVGGLGLAVRDGSWRRSSGRASTW